MKVTGKGLVRVERDLGFLILAQEQTNAAKLELVKKMHASKLSENEARMYLNALGDGDAKRALILDLHTAAGRLGLNIMFATANYERETK